MICWEMHAIKLRGSKKDKNIGRRKRQQNTTQQTQTTKLP